MGGDPCEQGPGELVLPEVGGALRCAGVGVKLGVAQPAVDGFNDIGGVRHIGISGDEGHPKIARASAHDDCWAVEAFAV